MIAKLIVRGSDRARALARLRQALAEVEIAGVTTNVAFLRRVVASRAFASARARHRTDRAQPRRSCFQQNPIPNELLAVAAFAEIAEEERSRARARRRARAIRIRRGIASTAGA